MKGKGAGGSAHKGGRKKHVADVCVGEGYSSFSVLEILKIEYEKK